MWVAQSLLPEDSRLTSELLASQRLFLGLCLLAFLPCALLVHLDQVGELRGVELLLGVGASPTLGFAMRFSLGESSTLSEPMGSGIEKEGPQGGKCAMDVRQ